MTTWVAIPDIEIATGKRITQTLMHKYRDNVRAFAEDDASVPLADTLKRMGSQNRIVVGTDADDGSNLFQVAGTLRSRDMFSIGTATGLPAAVTADMRLTGGVNKRIFVGDGTGYTLGFSKRVGSVTTDLMSIDDSTGAVVLGTDPGGSALMRIGGSVSIRVPMLWPAANAAGQLTNDGSGNLSWASGAALAEFWAKIANATVLSITGAGAATVNRMHTISGTGADFDIDCSAAPNIGDVYGFQVRDFANASKQYRLDFGGTRIVAGRVRYLILVHSNVILLQWTGNEWTPLACCLDTTWVDAGAIGLAAVSGGLVKGTTSIDKVYWRRVGSACEVRYTYLQTGAGTAGTGDYLFSLPIGTFDSTIAPVDTAAFTDVVRCGAVLGMFRARHSGDSAPFIFTALPYSTTQFRLTTDGSQVSATVRSVNNSTTQYRGYMTAPITSW